MLSNEEQKLSEQSPPRYNNTVEIGEYEDKDFEESSFKGSEECNEEVMNINNNNNDTIKELKEEEEFIEYINAKTIDKNYRQTYGLSPVLLNDQKRRSKSTERIGKLEKSPLTKSTTNNKQRRTQSTKVNRKINNTHSPGNQSNNNTTQSPNVTLYTPSFEDKEVVNHRNQNKLERVNEEKLKSSLITMKRNKERMKIKTVLESDREKVIAAKDKWRKKVELDWKKKLSRSPFQVDLLADAEKVEEEMKLKDSLIEREKQIERRLKERIKQEMLMEEILESSKKKREKKH
ncbi:hypothetical protein ABK040_010086 [Willaertia magna]